MPSELEQERTARDEARKRNIQANCLKWGVRDCNLIQFRGPNYRPLPPNYCAPQGKQFKTEATTGVKQQLKPSQSNSEQLMV